MTPKELLAKGFYLFPVVKNGKKPAHNGWQEESTNKLSEVKEWVAQGHNLGIDCSKSGIFVVDIDVKGGKPGAEEWKKWRDAADDHPKTLMFKTPSNGFHLVFKDPTGELLNKQFPEGIDFRGKGGLIIAPGSVIDGKSYSVLKDLPMLPAVPAWIAAKCENKYAPASAASAIPEDRIDDEDLVEAAVAYLEAAAPTVQFGFTGPNGEVGGMGDIETFNLACKIKDIGLSREMTLEKMTDHWNDRCTPPWQLEGRDSLQEKVYSAYKSGQNPVGSHANTATAALAFKDHVTVTLEDQGIDPMAPPAPYDPLTLVKVDTMSAFIREGHSLPPSKPLFSDFMFEKEATILFSDMGVGKTALGVQIARALASGSSIPGFPNESKPLRVLYCDFELSTRQLANRYADDGHFSDNMLRLELNTSAIPPGMTMADAILEAIPLLIKKYNLDVLVIDNLTYMGEDLTQVEEAARLMKGLKDVKENTNTTQLIVAHTPKRKEFEPLSINDLGGSRMIPNFVDAVFAIGNVKGDETLRYFKQLKVRSEEKKYGPSNVALCRLAKREGLLGFEFIECRRESDLIKGEYDAVPKKDERFVLFQDLVSQYISVGPPITLKRLTAAMSDKEVELGSANRLYARVKASFESKVGTGNRVCYDVGNGLLLEIFCDNARLKHIKNCAAHFGAQLHEAGTYGGEVI